MGLLSNLSGNAKLSAHHGGHGIQTASVMSAVTDSVDPTTQINWQTSNPTVQHTPKTASMADADEADKQASDYEAAVDQGCRLLRADLKKQKAHVKLIKEHRQYMAGTAQAHFEAAGANRGLAGKLLGLREGYAQLGYSLDRKVEVTNQRVEQLKHKLVGG